MCWRHLYFWRRVPAGQPRLQGRTIELMVCSSDKILGLLNLAVGAYSNGFLGTHTHTHTHTHIHTHTPGTIAATNPMTICLGGGERGVQQVPLRGSFDM